MCSQPPYGQLLAAANRLAALGFRRWLFKPGMEFLAREKWWGRGGARPLPHEGVDFCLFEDDRERQCIFPAASLVPAALAGRVVKIHPDILGHTIWLTHGEADGMGWRLHTIYGHVVPVADLAPGSWVAAGVVIGTVAAPAVAGKAITSHLHLSVARIAAGTVTGGLEWPLLHDGKVAQLLDPQFFLS